MRDFYHHWECRGVVQSDVVLAGAAVMQVAAMKDVTAASRALRQASESVKQLAQCRYRFLRFKPLFCVNLFTGKTLGIA